MRFPDAIDHADTSQHSRLLPVSWCITFLERKNVAMTPFVTTRENLEKNLIALATEVCPKGYLMVEAMFVEMDAGAIEFYVKRLSMDRNATGWHSNKHEHCGTFQ